MSRRIYLQVQSGKEAFGRVLLIEDGDKSEVFVYCPPAIANGPWIDVFDNMETALDLASLLARHMKQPTVLMTRDKVRWWLDGLTEIGEADELGRRDNG